MRTGKDYKLNWYKNLYVGNHAEKGVKKTIWRLNHGAGVIGYYLITLPAGEKNQLEIISSAYLKQKTLRRICPMVVGIAKGYDEALLLVQQIVSEVYEETGTARVREYLEERIDRTGK